MEQAKKITNINLKRLADKQEWIEELLNNKELLIEMISYKRLEEKERIGSDLAAKSSTEFTLFSKINSNVELKAEYEIVI